MAILYNFLLWLILPGLVLYHLYRSWSRQRPAALAPRFGCVDQAFLASLGGRRPIWIHAVSVGETIAVKPLIAGIRSRYPGVPIVVSNMTETGRSVARGIKEVDGCLYFPFDYRFATRRLLQQVNPQLIVVAETEIWPNFFRSARTLGIPAIIVNGRISDRSYGRYRRFRRFFRPVLADIAALCMQSDEDARRVTAIGADGAKVFVTRNLKFDIPACNISENRLMEMRAAYALDPACSVITAGSTHPGEEALVLDAFDAIGRSGHGALLVLVPRHPERAGEVAALLTERRLTFQRRSQLTADSPAVTAGGVLLVDTIGELMNLYTAADIVFVGGSLVPVGGHNLLEPASLGRPVLFGEYLSNFREIAAQVLDYGAGFRVSGAEELATVCSALLADQARRNFMGENGRRLLREQGGATALNLAVVDQFLRVTPHG